MLSTALLATLSLHVHLQPNWSQVLGNDDSYTFNHHLRPTPVPMTLTKPCLPLCLQSPHLPSHPVLIVLPLPSLPVTRTKRWKLSRDPQRCKVLLMTYPSSHRTHTYLLKHRTENRFSSQTNVHLPQYCCQKNIV